MLQEGKQNERTTELVSILTRPESRMLLGNFLAGETC